MSRCIVARTSPLCRRFSQGDRQPHQIGHPLSATPSDLRAPPDKSNHAKQSLNVNTLLSRAQGTITATWSRASGRLPARRRIQKSCRRQYNGVEHNKITQAPVGILKEAGSLGNIMPVSQVFATLVAVQDPASPSLAGVVSPER